jgi:hypothetical protein
MVIRILLRQINLGAFLMVTARSIIPAIIFPDGDSYSRLPSDIDQVVQLFCPDMLVLVLLPLLIDYFIGCTSARSLGITTQIKIMGEPSLIFTGL